MRHTCVLMIAACLLGSHSAHAELSSIKVLPPTYVVRQGTKQLAVHAERVSCAEDAKARTAVPGAPRFSYQLRSGSGALLESFGSESSCISAPVTRLTADGSRRPTPPNLREGNVQSCVISINYSTSFQPPTCVETHSVIASYTASLPTPTCAVKPSTESRTCPAGTSGTWSQTSTVSPYPGCVVTWNPSAPPATSCPPIAQPTGPVLTLSVVNVLEVHLAWTGTTSAAYSIEKCRGAGCTNFAPLTCTQASRYVDVLPATATARYRIRGNSQLNCSGSFGPYGAPQQVTVGGSVSTGQAFLSWTPGAENAAGAIAGFYIVYGRTAETLDRQIIVPGGNVTNYTVTGLASGSWVFGVKQYTANFAQVSNLSNLATKSVQ